VDPTFICPLEAPAADTTVENAAASKGPQASNRRIPNKNGPASDTSRLNRQRKKIARDLVEIQSTNWQSLLQYYTDDYVYEDPIVTIEGVDVMAEFLGRLFTDGPNIITTVEDEICINGIYMATWTMEGSFAGAPFSAKGMSVVKFRPNETQAYYSRDYYTEGDIMKNVPDLAPAVEGFRAFYRCAVDPTFPCPF